MKKILDFVLYILIIPLLSCFMISDTLANAENNLVPVKRVKASSELVSDGMKYAAENVVDGNEKTCWQEGVKGDGIGEYLELIFDTSHQVNNLSFSLGFVHDEDAFQANGVPRLLNLAFSDGSEFTAEFEKNMAEQLIELPWTVTADKVRIEIADVYSGKYYKDTAISEISVYDAKSEIPDFNDLDLIVGVCKPVLTDVIPSDELLIFSNDVIDVRAQDRTLKISLSGLQFKDVYEVNRTSTEPGHIEYAWSVFFSVKNEEYCVQTLHTKSKDEKQKAMSLEEMNHVMWKLNGEKKEAVREIEMSRDNSTMTWTIRNCDFDFTEMNHWRYSVRRALAESSDLE